MKISPIYSRCFGVEVECGHQEGHDYIRQVIMGNAKHLRRGIADHSYNTLSKQQRVDCWSVGYDGSGVEVRTPVLRGAAGFKTLEKVFDILKKEECWVTNRDGLHIHHDTPEFCNSPEKIFELVYNWTVNRAAISCIVAQERQNRGGAQPWNLARLEEIRHAQDFNDQVVQMIQNTGRKDITISEIARSRVDTYDQRVHNIEIRLHEGTLDYGEAEAWIMLGQKMIHNTLYRKRPMTPAETPEQLLRRLRMGRKQRLLLLDKVARNGMTLSRIG